MKILELRFKNLNSLYGEWKIDFTHPEYTSNGIFALTGPTGAGKTTILDAICLALYGETPRLAKFSNTKNEIMSKQTGACYAEVVFESQAGLFRCKWAQKRSRNNPKGKLQNPEHQIIDAINNVPIATALSTAQKAIEERTGMDFDRFTRSMLLAQGNFDNFLKAREEEKSKVLEQITGSEIYTTISKLVHEKNKEQKGKLDALQATLSGITFLTTEEEEACKQALLDAGDCERKARRTGETITTAITWWNTLDGLQRDSLVLAKEEDAWQADNQAFAPERVTLAQAQRASTLEGSYTKLTTIDKAQADDTLALKNESDNLPQVQEKADQQAAALKQAEAQTVTCNKTLQDTAPLLQQVRELDQSLIAQNKAIATAEIAYKQESEKQVATKKSKDQEEKQLKKAQVEGDSAAIYLQKHASDALLNSELTGLMAQCQGLTDIQKYVASEHAKLASAQTTLLAAKVTLDKCKKEEESNIAKLDRTASELKRAQEDRDKLLNDKLLREYRSEKDSLLKEKAYMATIASLEEHRTQLVPGKECPLCGSIEHPFAADLPKPTEIDKKITAVDTLISKVEELDALIEKAEKREKSDAILLTKCAAQVLQAQNTLASIQERKAEATDSLEALLLRLADSKDVLYTKLTPLAIPHDLLDDIPTLTVLLHTRHQAWQTHSAQAKEVKTRVSAHVAEINRLQTIWETEASSLGKSKVELDKLKNTYEVTHRRRMDIFGEKSPAKEESHLRQAIERASATEQTARTNNATTQTCLTAAKTKTEALQAQIEQRAESLRQAGEEFQAALTTAGFESAQDFNKAWLPSEELDKLKTKAKALDNRLVSIKARQMDCNTRLETEKAKALSTTPLEELQTQLHEAQAAMRALTETILGYKLKLTNNQGQKTLANTKINEIERQSKECEKWRKLDGHIGSSDGKKFRNYAQGLTFEIMVSHANRELTRMNGRYLLIRDEKSPLELNVIDTEQSGEVRPTSNLSGGESFIVSLALALGLSKMASKRVRVDTLFLDEGFGTLDDETLETALEALAGLHAQGKLIGIISHVSKLKERISTQIAIEPQSGGKSSIIGAGCVRV